MKSVITTLLSLLLLGSNVLAERIPVEGWYKSTGSEFGEKWKDSGRRTHFFSVKGTAEVTIYGEGFGFKGKAESDWALSIVDKYVNGSIVSRTIWTSEKDTSNLLHYTPTPPIIILAKNPGFEFVCRFLSPTPVVLVLSVKQ